MTYEETIGELVELRRHPMMPKIFEPKITAIIEYFAYGDYGDRPKGEWEYDPNGMDWNIPAWRCSECGYVATHIGIADKGIGGNPMNWAGSKYCPQCGCKIVGARTRGGK